MANKKRFATFLCIMICFSFCVQYIANAKSISVETIGDTKKYKEIYNEDNINNYVLNKVTDSMPEIDKILAFTLVTDFHSGYKECEDALYDLIKEYYPYHAPYLLNYILYDSWIIPFANLTIKDDRTIIYNQVKGITPDVLSEEEIRMIWNIWDEIKELFDYEDLKHFKQLDICMNRAEDEMVSINPIDETFEQWQLTIDKSLIDDVTLLRKNIIYAIAFYKGLNKNNFDLENDKKGVYKKYGYNFKSDSAMNLFYKKFWKNRYLEYNAEQISQYQNAFYNRRASRSIHDDFSEAFYQFIINGSVEIKNTLDQKTNFFENKQEYVNTAERIRKKIGTKKRDIF